MKLVPVALFVGEVLNAPREAQVKRGGDLVFAQRCQWCSIRGH